MDPYITPPEELLRQIVRANRIYGGSLASPRERELFDLLYRLAQCVVQLDKQLNRHR